MIAGVAEGNSDFSVQRELEGIGDQIEYDLFPEVVRGLHAPGFNAGEIEQGIDELEQAQAVAVDEGEPAALGAADICAGAHEFLERSEHQGQRGTEFVTHVAEVGGLGAGELGEGIRPPLRVRESAGVGERSGDLAGGKSEEAAVGIVEHQSRAQARDQHPCANALPGKREGKHQRRIRRRRTRGRRSHPEAFRQSGDSAVGDLCDQGAVQVQRRGQGAHGLVDAIARIEQAQERESQIVIVAVEHVLCGGEDGLLVNDAGGARCKFAQHPQAPLANDLLGRFSHCRKHAADPA